MPFRIFGTAFFIIERIANAKQVFYYCIVICKRMGLLKLPVLTMAITAATLGCSSDDDVVKYNDGMLVDYSKFTGCGWVIESDNERFEPTNLDKFDTVIVLIDSMKVRFACVEEDDQTSSCMVGTVVRLIDIYQGKE